MVAFPTAPRPHAARHVHNQPAMAMAVPASMNVAVAVAVAFGLANTAVVACTSFRCYWTGLPAAWRFPPVPMSDPTSVPLLTDALGTLSDARV